MTCDEATRLIGRARGDDTEPETSAALIEHLEGCSACRHESEAQGLVSQVLASRPPEELPSGLADRLAARLDAESAPASKR